MKVEALSIGIPREIEYNGRSISTGIFKSPVEGPRKVGRSGIDGDGQADLTVHGGVDKAVYAFPVEHYDFYRNRLGGEPYPPGQFGENLTISGLSEAIVRIGDRYRVGDVLFEVSQPRAPCFKFAIKMGSRDAIELCLITGRTGFYLRVLEEGMIESGAQIVFEQANPTAPTVQEVHRLCYLDTKNVTILSRAARCEALSQGLRDAFKARLKEIEVA